jgi:hypothetical protein
MLRPLPYTAHLATSRRRDGVRVFCERFRDSISLDLFVHLYIYALSLYDIKTPVR